MILFQGNVTRNGKKGETVRLPLAAVVVRLFLDSRFLPFPFRDPETHSAGYDNLFAPLRRGTLCTVLFILASRVSISIFPSRQHCSYTFDHYTPRPLISFTQSFVHIPPSLVHAKQSILHTPSRTFFICLTGILTAPPVAYPLIHTYNVDDSIHRQWLPRAGLGDWYWGIRSRLPRHRL